MHAEVIAKKYAGTKNNLAKKNNYFLIQYKQNIEVSGQGEYEITVKNLVNANTLKVLTPSGNFINIDQIRSLKNKKN